jgi:hypothetical protein
VIGGDHPLWEAMVEADLTPTERLVLLVVAARAGSNGECWPSHADIAKRSALSPERVRTILRQLRRLGFVEVIGRHPAEAKSADRWPLHFHLPLLDDRLSGTGRDRLHTTGREARPVSHDRSRPVAGNRRDRLHTTGRSISEGPVEGPLPARSPSARRTATPPSPLRARAQAVLDPWWERQEVKPARSYMACLKACEAALHGGMSDTDLARAIGEVPTITGGAFDYWRNRQRGNGTEPLSDEQHAAIANMRQREDRARAALRRPR